MRYRFSDPPREGWKNYNGSFEVAGVHHRRNDAVDFIRGAIEADNNGWENGVELVRDRNNPHDPNAIKVVGSYQKKAGFFGRKLKNIEQFIGYVPAGIAAELSDRPVQARLISGHISDNGVVYIKIQPIVKKSKSG